MAQVARSLGAKTLDSIPEAVDPLAESFHCAERYAAVAAVPAMPWLPGACKRTGTGDPEPQAQGS